MQNSEEVCTLNFEGIVIYFTDRIFLLLIGFRFQCIDATIFLHGTDLPRPILYLRLKD